MKARVAVSTLLAAIVAGFFCVAMVVIASSLHVLPNFPAYGGEDDFSFRFLVFAFAVLPAFVLFGAIVGHRARTAKARLSVILGGLAGSGVALALARALTRTIEALPSRTVANGAAVGFLIAWALLSFAGALAASQLNKRARSLPH